MRAHALAVLALFLTISASVAQRPVFDLAGSSINHRYGQAMVVVEDLDGDGWREILVGVPGDVTARVVTGAVRVLSGRTRAVISSVFGAQPDEEFGFSIAAVGDLDNDGFTEIAVGSPLFDGATFPDAGKITLLRWGGTGAGYVPLFTDSPAHAGANLGWSVAPIGDYDGDRVPDFAVGAPRYDNGRSPNAGRVLVYSGASRYPVLTEILPAAGEDGLLGWSVTGVHGPQSAWGIAAGAPETDSILFTNSGLVMIVTAVGSVTVPGNAAGAKLGWSVAGVSDLDSDGVREVAAGAIGDSTRYPGGGAVLVLSGRTGVVRSKLYGENANDEFGSSLASGVDFDGDGLWELAVGTRLNDNFGPDAGCAYLMSPAHGHILMVLNGREPNERLGGAVALGLAGPGVSPPHGRLVLVGAPEAANAGAQPAAGRLRAFDDQLPVAWILPAGGWGDRTGEQVVGLGDVNGDGHDDFAVGIPNFGSGFPNAGQVVVISGATGGVYSDLRGPVPFDHFGERIGALGDLNGDGHADMITTLRLNSSNPNGDIWRIDSPNGNTILRRASHGQVGVTNGPFVGLGDLDADGYPDYGASLVPSKLTAYSGRTGALLREFATLSGFISVRQYCGLGDVDRDGYDDVGLAAGNGVDVRSGRTGAVLHAHSGDSCAPAGDVDRDGFPDYLVHNDAFLVQSTVILISGRQHTVLREWFDGQVLSGFMSGVGLGDVDGDGVPDLGLQYVASGSSGAFDVRVVSGRTFSTLAVYSRCGSMVGASGLSRIGDVDQDGYADIVIGDPRYNNNDGIARRFSSFGLGGTLPLVQYRGVGCPGSNQSMPRITADRPALNEIVFPALRGALPNTLCFLMLGAPTDLELTAFGAPGCHLYIDLAASPFVQFVPTSSAGGALWPLPIPNNPGLLGVRFDCQWGIFDAAANSLGFVFSNASINVIGRWR